MGSTIFPYVSGILMEPLTHAFGWTRSEFSFAFLLQVLVGLFAGPFFGRVIDRFGPRRVILAGIPVATCGLSLLGLVGQNIWQWWALVVFQGLAMAPVLPVAWVAVVVARFEINRGLALAVALAGVGLGAAVWPALGTLVIGRLGWRATFPALGVGWGLIVFALASLLLKDEPQSHDTFGTKRQNPSPRDALRSPIFLLTAAGSVFITVVYGFNLHLVSILKGFGFSLTAAATVAGFAGVSAVVGRLLMGLLLDRLPTRPMALGVFMLPLLAIALFWNAHEANWVPMVAVILLGLSLGAETDIIAFVASRQLEPRVFASSYAVAAAAFGACSALGPLLASLAFDATHSYRVFFIAAGPAILFGAVLIAMVPMRPKTD
ncbi:MAG TPA: MFS transporter [Sphingobium sp.]|uniref:MFS transporter n=1 Tax=Sphingobium sp. TaxID=1912891 RepID=UPI002ED3B64A